MGQMKELKRLIDEQLDLQLDTMEALFRNYILLQVRSDHSKTLSEDGVVIVSDYVFDQFILKLADRIKENRGGSNETSKS